MSFGRIEYSIDLLINRVKELERLMVEVMAHLDALRITTGRTGNQWLTIPPPPTKGEGHGTGEPSEALHAVPRV